MPKRSRKPASGEVNQIARSAVDQVTGVSTPKPRKKAARKKPEKAKDPHAVALGRKGGLKGGPARAAKLTKKQLSESARRAALARWTAR